MARPAEKTNNRKKNGVYILAALTVVLFAALLLFSEIPGGDWLLWANGALNLPYGTAKRAHQAALMQLRGLLGEI